MEEHLLQRSGRRFSDIDSRDKLAFGVRDLLLRDAEPVGDAQDKKRSEAVATCRSGERALSPFADFVRVPSAPSPSFGGASAKAAHRVAATLEGASMPFGGKE